MDADKKIIDGKTLDRVTERVDRIEDKVDKVEARVSKVETQQEVIKDQHNRIMSHIESESIAARDDIGKIDKQLFGDRTSRYSGMLGEMLQEFHQIKTWFMAVIAATSIIGFVIAVYYFYSALTR